MVQWRGRRWRSTVTDATNPPAVRPPQHIFFYVGPSFSPLFYLFPCKNGTEGNIREPRKYFCSALGTAHQSRETIIFSSLTSIFHRPHIYEFYFCTQLPTFLGQNFILFGWRHIKKPFWGSNPLPCKMATIKFFLILVPWKKYIFLFMWKNISAGVCILFPTHNHFAGVFLALTKVNFLIAMYISEEAWFIHKIPVLPFPFQLYHSLTNFSWGNDVAWKGKKWETCLVWYTPTFLLKLPSRASK